MPPVLMVPPLSTSTAHALAILFSGSYVGSLYISKNGRLSFKHGSNLSERHSEARGRDDPEVIKARMVAVCLSTVLSITVVFWVMLKCEGGGWEVSVIDFSGTFNLGHVGARHGRRGAR